MNIVPCDTRATLLSDYQHATLKYSNAVSDLSKNIGICVQDRYKILCRIEEEARLAVMEARRVLEKHCARHGC